LRRYKLRKIRSIDSSLLDDSASYLAGLLDGEGAFTIHWHKSNPLYFEPLIGIGMTHEETISFVARLLGVSYATRERKKSFKTMFYTGVTRRADLKIILDALKPRLITKRKQAELLLEFLSPEKTPSQKTRMKTLQKQADIYVKLRELNMRGTKPFDCVKERESVLGHIQKKLEETPPKKTRQ
jgi:hypothetical protein